MSLDLEQEADPLNVDHFSCTPLVSVWDSAGKKWTVQGGAPGLTSPLPTVSDVGLCPGALGGRCAPLPLEQTGAEHS